MDSTIISAWIAFAGVILTLIFPYYVSRRNKKRGIRTRFTPVYNKADKRLESLKIESVNCGSDDKIINHYSIYINAHTNKKTFPFTEDRNLLSDTQTLAPKKPYKVEVGKSSFDNKSSEERVLFSTYIQDTIGNRFHSFAVIYNNQLTLDNITLGGLKAEYKLRVLHYKYYLTHKTKLLYALSSSLNILILLFFFRVSYLAGRMEGSDTPDIDFIKTGPPKSYDGTITGDRNIKYQSVPYKKDYILNRKRNSVASPDTVAINNKSIFNLDTFDHGEEVQRYPTYFGYDGSSSTNCIGERKEDEKVYGKNGYEDDYGEYMLIDAPTGVKGKTERERREGNNRETERIDGYRGNKKINEEGRHNKEYSKDY